MVEQLIIGVLFLSALGFLGRKIYMSLRPDKGCAKGCGCSEADAKENLRKAWPR